MSRIYVITAGEYSDYRIYGVTCDPERASVMRQIVDAHLGSLDEAKIEEFDDGIFEDDAMASIVPAEYYSVVVRTGSDNVNVWKHLSDSNRTIEISDWSWRGPWVRNENGYPKREIATEYRVRYIRADSEEKAIKIAMDKIAEYRVKKGELDQ